MKFLAEINIMPLKTLLDPQGKAVSSSMKNINLEEISNFKPSIFSGVPSTFQILKKIDYLHQFVIFLIDNFFLN